MNTVASAEPAAAPASTAAPTEAQRALTSAKESGVRVEVTGDRSERTTVYANPDGYSFTLEESSVPVRIAKAGGGWETPDPTLVRRADGTIVPKASAVEMEFSGGGSGDPLVRIEENGRSLALGWPAKLPAPELEGSNAVYREVMKGVDLRVTASTEGFRHVLVVKTREAAANPELKEIDYSLKSTGLKIVEGKAGNLAAVDADGNRVFRAPPAQMWDSAGGAAATSAKAPAGGSAATSAKAPAGGSAATSAKAPAGGPVATSAKAQAGRTAAAPAAGPSATGSAEPPVDPGTEAVEPSGGDTVVKMDVNLTPGTLTVAPDAAMLRGTDADDFPLYIDPTVTWDESERTLLRSDGYESYGWENDSDGKGKGVGHCGTWNGYYCGPGYTQRLYFEFSPEKLKGKSVLGATFRVTEPWAFQCDPRWVDLVRTNNISSATTWSSRPAELDHMVDRSVSAGRGSACDPDSPDAPIEFSDNPEESNENLTPTVKSFAAGSISRLTLQLRAHDETDTSAWKRFRNDAVLAVNFVGLPDKPTGVGMVAGSGTVCDRTEADPAIVSDPTPLLKATAQTKAGGEQEAQLRIYFDLDHKNADGTWSDSPDGNGSVRPSTGSIGDGQSATLTWSSLTDGKLYRYQAYTHSLYNGGASWLTSGSSGFCYFKIDSSAPKAPRIVIRGPYSECLSDTQAPNDPTPCEAAGGPGTKASFLFAPASVDDNVTDFQYRLSQSASWVSVCQSGVPCLFSAVYTPQKSGTYTIYARAKDTVGRWGAQSTLQFRVDLGEAPVGRWRFDEASGVAIDTATGGGGVRQDATLAGGAARDERGRRGLVTHDSLGKPLATPSNDRGLALNGTGAYAATTAPVVNTGLAYTVSAWVRLDSKAQDGAVVAQDGTKYSPFLLWYENDRDRWAFGVKENADNATQHVDVSSENVASAGVWTHLAGSYDPDKKELRFYVNGKLQGTKAVAASWSATGPFNIGRNLWAASRTAPFKGSVDEVAAWQRALPDDEVADEARTLTNQSYAGAELVANWTPDTAVGTTVTDTTSGYGRSLALTGGSTVVNGEIVLDGVDDSATTTGPVVDDTGSFTTSTLVALDGAALATKSVGYKGQVLGQRTADGSSWGFWFELTDTDVVVDKDTYEDRTVAIGKWHFGRLNADGTFTSVVSDQVAELDGLVRLTGVHDAQAGTISLYLGHNENGEGVAYTAALGSGEFALGKGVSSGSWSHHLPARIAEVRIWAGAMASPDQIDNTVGD
ncbi:LamG-like jellyroll fold domain-containing protein [Streptomyces sp. NPDC056480]|uniref:LamG-like jellyroll fold domain-containing protein n=1 Tax=Streptomyces sp. NPDC056480 TaxID=3345833 RepID=UPI0036B670FB